MKVNDIVTVMTTTGEYVGKLTQMDTAVVLQDPRMITANEQGMGFASGVAMSGEENPKEMTIMNPVFLCATNSDVADAWRTMTSGIVTPNSKLVV
jgi:hypothetical protein